MADVSGILAAAPAPIAPPNPLTTLQTLQGLQVQQQQLKNMQTQNEQQNYTLNTARANRAAQIALGFYGSTNDPVEMERNIRQHIEDNVNNGTLSRNVANVALSQIPTAITADGSATPIETYHSLLLSHIAPALTAENALNAVRPNGQWVDFGGEKRFITSPPQLSPLGMSPTEQASQTNSVPPGMTTITVPNGGGPGIPGPALRSYGGGAGLPPSIGPNPSPQGMPPPAQSLPNNYSQPQAGQIPANRIPPPVGSVRPGPGGIPINGPMAPGSLIGPDGQPWPTTLPSQGTPGGQPQMLVRTPQGNRLVPVTQAPAPVAAPSPQAPASAAPGMDPYSTAVPIGTQKSLEDNQQAYRNAQQSTAGIPIQNAQWIEAHDLINNLSKSNLTTGALQGYMNQARRLLTQFGVSPEMAANVNDAATAEKLMAKLVASQAPASDARQSLLEHANPSLNMPAGATLPIIRQIVAGNRAIQAEPLEAKPNSFLTDRNVTANKLNTPEGLKALSWDLIPPNERVSIIKDLKAKGGAALSNFETALQTAQKLKLLRQAPTPVQAPAQTNPLLTPSTPSTPSLPSNPLLQ